MMFGPGTGMSARRNSTPKPLDHINEATNRRTCATRRIHQRHHLSQASDPRRQQTKPAEAGLKILPIHEMPAYT